MLDFQVAGGVLGTWQELDCHNVNLEFYLHSV